MLVAVTATDGRPGAFGLLVRHLAAQSHAGPLRWVVSGRDLAGYPIADAAALCAGRGWEFAVLAPGAVAPGEDAMVRNLRAAFALADEGDRVVFLEDDDYVAPGFLAAYDAALAACPMVGAPNARYYNVRSRRWRRMANASHASLAQTGLSGDAIGFARRLLGARPRSLQYDRHLWVRWGAPRRLDPGLSPLHVSIKGLPGTPGYGVGHRDDFGAPDEGLRVFRAWGLPDDYLEFGEGR